MLQQGSATAEGYTVPVEDELPPLTGHPDLDLWRLRARAELAGELPPAAGQGPTRSEAALWSLLEQEPIGWVREYATGPYRLDFFCPTARLAVEVDGSSHHGAEAWARDDERDRWHAQQGIRTSRFSADQVERDPQGVLSEIRRQLRVRLGLEEEQFANNEPGGPARPVLPARRAPRPRPRARQRRGSAGPVDLQFVARMLLALLVVVAVFLQWHDQAISRWYFQGTEWFFQRLVEGAMNNPGVTKPA